MLRLLLAHIFCLLCLLQNTPAAEQPSIAAASDLQFALREIATRFNQDTGHGLRLSFGSSGNFKRLIQQGARYEMFLSADEAYVQALSRAGLTEDEGTLYALGRVMLYARNASPLSLDSEFAGLKQALSANPEAKFAIANPEHAPYGRAAREVLEHAGLWPAIRTQLVMGENASQATQFANSSSTIGGIIPHSLYSATQIKQGGRAILIPSGWHRPLRQRMVLLKQAGDISRSFYQYMQSRTALDILQRYGFSTQPED